MKVIGTLFCFVVFGLSNVGHTQGQETKMIDAVDQPSCEDLLARLDRFSHHVSYNPTPSVGQIILFPGSEEIENTKYEKFLRNYLVRRNLQDKVPVQIAKPAKKMRVEFWSGPIGTSKTVETSKLTRTLPVSSRPILFDSDLFEMFADKGRNVFVGVSCSACCISNLDWNLFSEFLTENPVLKPYVVIRGKPSRHRSLKSTLDRDMKDAGFDGRKVRYLFANKNLINTSHFSEVAVFFSPKNIWSADALRSDFDQYD